MIPEEASCQRFFEKAQGTVETPEALIISTVEMCRASGETEARRQLLRNPQSLRLNMKTFGFSDSHPFHPSTKDLLWSSGQSQRTT